jgi:hypothetical protein
MHVLIDFRGDHGKRYQVYECDRYNRPQRILTPKGKSPDENFPHIKQIEYFDSEEPNVMFGGGRGGGKSEAIIWDSIFKAYLVPGSRQMILRRTMGELEKTIMDRYKSLPKDLVGVYHGTQSAEHFEFPNGSKVYFGSARTEDDVRKLLSGEYLCVHFDEWSEWPYSMWKFIAGSVRTVVEYDVLGREVHPQVKGATNPGGIGGDVLNHLFGCDVPKSVPKGEDPEAYDPKDYLFVQSMIDDNPAYRADRPAGIAYRKMLQSMPRRVRDAWLLGKWSGFEGQYFDCLEESTMRVPHDLVVKLMHKQHWQPIWLGIDWGQAHHAYCSWNTFLEFQLRDGASIKLPVTYREFLVKGLGEAALAEEILDYTPDAERKRVERIYLSPETFGDNILSRARRMGNVFVGAELPRPVEAFNSRADGWSKLYDLLVQRHRLNEGWRILNPDTLKTEYVDLIAGWLIDEECENAHEAIPWAMADPKKDGDIVKEGDSPNLDILDGLRYGIASHIRPEEKPFGEKAKEILGSLPTTGSSRYIKHLQLMKEAREESKPTYMSPFRRHRGR